MVGVDGRLVYESLVLPDSQVADYNTRFSGITQKDLGENWGSSSIYMYSHLILMALFICELAWTASLFVCSKSPSWPWNAFRGV